jgi:hypothetical protein
MNVLLCWLALLKVHKDGSMAPSPLLRALKNQYDHWTMCVSLFQKLRPSVAWLFAVCRHLQKVIPEGVMGLLSFFSPKKKPRERPGVFSFFALSKTRTEPSMCLFVLNEQTKVLMAVRSPALS